MIVPQSYHKNRIALTENKDKRKLLSYIANNIHVVAAVSLSNGSVVCCTYEQMPIAGGERLYRRVVISNTPSPECIMDDMIFDFKQDKGITQEWFLNKIDNVKDSAIYVIYPDIPGFYELPECLEGIVKPPEKHGKKPSKCSIEIIPTNKIIKQFGDFKVYQSLLSHKITFDGVWVDKDTSDIYIIEGHHILCLFMGEPMNKDYDKAIPIYLLSYTY